MTIIKRPIISEKSIAQGTVNKYTFLVTRVANKSQIALAIEKLFKVKVTDVNVLNLAGKRKKFRRTMGQRDARRKAMVTLKAGDRIALFEENK
ncbi:MAG: 50S ribosomal protein L23 [Patescibacteria group bacterium]|jgi:large subunit ribosomal protein L23